MTSIIIREILPEKKQTFKKFMKRSAVGSLRGLASLLMLFHKLLMLSKGILNLKLYISCINIAKITGSMRRSNDFFTNILEFLLIVSSLEAKAAVPCKPKSFV